MVTHAPIAVLGIDQGERSGWAVAVVGNSAYGRSPIVARGVARTCLARRAAIDEGVAAAEWLGHLLVVFEDHSAMPLIRKTRWDPKHQGAPERSTASILGQGAARGRWEEQLDLRGHPDALRMDVEPYVWRKAVLGMRRRLTEDECKAQALRWACAHVGAEIQDHNEAEGIAITAWGACDGRVLLEAQREQRKAARRIVRGA